jgi:hypothetical protein
LLLRGSREGLAPHLPQEFVESLTLVRGMLVCAASFVRRGRVGRFLPRDRLTWFAGGRELPTGHGSRRFEHRSDRFSVSLNVFAGSESELVLEAEACAHPEGSLFPSARAAAEFLADLPATRADQGRAWEPLAPLRAEWRLPGLSPEINAALAFDSAYRQVARRLAFQPGVASRTALRAARVRPLPGN